MSRLPSLLNLLFLIVILLAAAGCRAPAQRSPAEEIVPCPLTRRANTVLQNVIERCASNDGKWSHDLGPGCPMIWATQFGFTAGLRRQRKDLIELAEVTAAHESAALSRLIIGRVFGGKGESETDSRTFGLPALFISGVLNHSGSDYAKFRLAFDRALEEFDFDSLSEPHRAGLAVLLAQLGQTEPDESEMLLAKARRLAQKISGPKFRAFALAAIARSSDEDADLERARHAVEEAIPKFRLEGTKLVVEPEKAFALSRYLALIHALADLAQLTGNPDDRTRADALLAFVFSASFFDGNILAHDGTRAGYRSGAFCSGCNLEALYLVDRLYGDTFKIDPLPKLPERPDVWMERVDKTHNLFAVYPNQAGVYSITRFGVKIGYDEVAASGEHPHGAVKLSFQLTDATQSCTFSRQGEEAVLVPLDAHDRASYRLGPDSVVRGSYDPGVSSYTVKVGPAQDGRREIRIFESYTVTH